MIIKKFSEYGCKKMLRTFVEEMFGSWKNESSFSMDNICCPQRPINEIMNKIDLIDAETSDFIVCFDEEAGDICGMLYITFECDKSAHISLVNVNPQYRRKKVGFSLLSYAVILSSNKGIDSIKLETWNGNNRAIALFKKLGFFTTSGDERRIELKSFLPKLLHETYENTPLDYSILNNESFLVEATEDNDFIVMNYINSDKQCNGYKVLK